MTCQCQLEVKSMCRNLLFIGFVSLKLTHKVNWSNIKYGFSSPTYFHYLKSDCCLQSYGATTKQVNTEWYILSAMYTKFKTNLRKYYGTNKQGNMEWNISSIAHIFKMFIQQLRYDYFSIHSLKWKLTMINLAFCLHIWLFPTPYLLIYMHVTCNVSLLEDRVLSSCCSTNSYILRFKCEAIFPLDSKNDYLYTYMHTYLIRLSKMLGWCILVSCLFISQLFLINIHLYLQGAGIAIRPYLSDLVYCMLESLSSLEDQGMNYVEVWMILNSLFDKNSILCFS